MQKMKLNKSPGVDGLPTTIFKLFGVPLLRLLASLKKGQYHSEW